jgi:hypothetical protein
VLVMTAVTDPRPLADLEQDALARVEEEFARRAQGVKPWTPAEYLDRIERVHAHYAQRRQWLRTHPDAAGLDWIDERARRRIDERPLWRMVKQSLADTDDDFMGDQ